MQNQVLRFARKLFEGRIQIESVGRRGDAQRALQIGGTGAGAEAAFEQRLGPIHDHFRRIEIVFRAEAVAFGACAVGRIEAEGTRLELRNRNAAIGAGELLGIDVLFAADHRDRDEAAGQLQRGFDGLLEALRDAIFQQQTVHHDFDGVILAAVERDRLIEIHQIAIHARADVAFLRVLLEFLFVFALAAANHWREHHDAVVRLQRQHRLHDLFGGLARDGLAAIGAVRRADGAVNHAQIIVNFRDGADGGARRTRRGLLLDGDRRRKAFDGIDVGALHLIEKLARVGGKRFDVAALAFGVQACRKRARICRNRKAL